MRDCKRDARGHSAPPAAPMSGLGFSMPTFSGHTRDKTAAYALGIGTMGVIAGLGLGGKPNTLVLLVGVGSLFYANYQANLVKITPSRGVRESAHDLRRRVPAFPSGGRQAQPAPFDLF
jgi:hypothetical protein